MKYPIIYDGNETDFTHYGLGVLSDVLECTVTEELNNTFECEFTYPSNCRLANVIKEEDIVKVNASYNLRGQLFRVYRIEKALEGKCKARCQHISYDMVDDFVELANYNNISIANALQRMIDNSLFCKRFKAHSDIFSSRNIFIQHSSLFSAIKGSKGSLLDAWGRGDLLRDNFDIYILRERGQQKNILLHQGKNVTSLNYDLDYTDLCTVIYPYAKIKEEWNGFDKTISLSEKFIYSPLVNSYKKKYIKAVDFTNDKIRNKEDLKNEASKYFSRNLCDVPLNNVKLNLVNEKVGLGDTVIVRVPRLNISLSMRIVKLKFNPILDRIEDVELGDLRKINKKGGM